MIFIAGPHGAGKTHITNYLCEEGFKALDTGPYLRMYWQQQSPSIPFSQYVKDNETLYGRHFTNQILADEISRIRNGVMGDKKVPGLLITGFRSLDGVNFIQERCLNTDLPNKIILYIDANEAVLYSRYCRREGKISTEDFRSRLEVDKKMGLEGLKTAADFIVQNNGSDTEFKHTIDELIFDKLGYERTTLFGERGYF